MFRPFFGLATLFFVSCFVLDSRAEPGGEKPEDPASKFLNEKFDRYNELLFIFWKNTGDQQHWQVTVEFKSKTKEEKKWSVLNARLNYYLDFNQLKSMCRLTSDLLDMKAYFDAKKTLLLSRDTKQYHLLNMENKVRIEKLKDIKKDKKKWQVLSQRGRKEFFEKANVSQLKLLPQPKEIEKVSCDVLTFSRGPSVNYELYFDRKSGWLRGLKLDGGMKAFFVFESNAQGLPSKFTAKIAGLPVSEMLFDFDVNGSLNWQDGKFVNGQVILTSFWDELLQIEVKIDVKLDDKTTLEKNLFQPRFNRDSYKLKSFQDYKNGLMDHAASAYADLE